MNSYQVDLAKWRKLTIFEQMGNIGSEVGRAYSAYRRDNSADFLGAYSRGLDLFDATAKVWALKRDVARTREILRARDQFVQAMVTGEADEALENYFMQFAMAARLQR
ncbi:MAG TPA: hypothetical protein VGG13_01855 [Candidatus Saccharimonadales bacterium]|jgi:hypothetical protein